MPTRSIAPTVGDWVFVLATIVVVLALAAVPFVLAGWLIRGPLVICAEMAARKPTAAPTAAVRRSPTRRRTALAPSRVFLLSPANCGGHPRADDAVAECRASISPGNCRAWPARLLAMSSASSAACTFAGSWRTRGDLRGLRTRRTLLPQAACSSSRPNAGLGPQTHRSPSNRFVGLRSATSI